jgi:site-specific DNA-methyltransferase (adenine-specific)
MRKEVFGSITLYQGDCMEYMAGLDDKAFDLAVVDPPYGINAGKMQMGERQGQAMEAG